MLERVAEGESDDRESRSKGRAIEKEGEIDRRRARDRDDGKRER